MSAVRQIWCQPANIQNSNSEKLALFCSSQRPATKFSQVAKVSLPSNLSLERPLLLQSADTAANTLEQRDYSLATSIPAVVPPAVRNDDALLKERVTLAQLIKGVYEMEYRRLVGISFEENPPARSWWECVNFDLIDEFDSERAAEEQDRGIDLAVYKWNDSAPAAGSPPCRRVVIAIRGTLPSMEDGWHNLHGSLQRLHLTPRYRRILEVVKTAIAAYGSDEICITGHSLGASLGLLVARTLATEEGTQIDAHLFNPVYSYSWVPTSDELLENEELWRTLRTVRCVTVAGLANILMDEEERERIAREYANLRSWTPHIYVNTGDPICRGYWEYFSNHERLARNGAMGAYFAHLAAPFSGRGLLTTVFGSKPSHLIPSAVLHVCEGELPRWPGTDIARYSGHHLGSWMAEDLPMHTRYVKLSSW